MGSIERPLSPRARSATPRLQSYGLFLRGWALADANDAGAVGKAENGVAMAPNLTGRCYTSGFLAYAHLRAGNLHEAARQLEEAVLGRAQRLLGDVATARQSAERAVEVAEKWSYPLGEAWARRSLGRIESADAAGVDEGSLQSAERIFQAIGARHELARASEV